MQKAVEVHMKFKKRIRQAVITLWLIGELLLVATILSSMTADFGDLDMDLPHFQPPYDRPAVNVTSPTTPKSPENDRPGPNGDPTTDSEWSELVELTRHPTSFDE